MSYSVEHIKLLKGLKIVHVNVRSVLKHFDEIESTFLDGGFDVVLLTESWFHANVGDNLVSAKGYNLTRLDWQSKMASGVTKSGGGIIIPKGKSFF